MSTWTTCWDRHDRGGLSALPFYYRIAILDDPNQLRRISEPVPYYIWSRGTLTQNSFIMKEYTEEEIMDLNAELRNEILEEFGHEE